MKKIFVLLIILASLSSSDAQNTHGTIEYDRATDWIEIMSKLPWVTQESIDRNRLTWGKHERKPVKYDLYFNTKEMLYDRKEVESEGGYSWKENKFYLIHNFKDTKTNDWVEVLGKKYLIKDEAPKYKWKIHNEIKEVAGYLCMKAETFNEVKKQKVYAWFTNEIPVSGGPEGYYGLPGMIMELDLDDGACVVTAVNVSLEDNGETLPSPKKMKGKEVSRLAFNEMIVDFIDQMIEGERNPYWRIRY